MKAALNIFRKFDHQPEAMKLAIQLNDVELIKDIFVSCTGRYSTMIQSSVTVYNYYRGMSEFKIMIMNHEKNLVTVQTMLLVVNHHRCTQMP